MTREELIKQIKIKRSFLCVGLDPDLSKIPTHLLDLEDPIFEFNRAIIEATEDLCVAYKPNIAFYECYGVKGLVALQKTFDFLPKNCFSIADAKRGDIGNTSKMYAKAFFDPTAAGLNFDSVTIAPYMGKDSISPFLEFDKKWAIVLALTSNIGSEDFQTIKDTSGKNIFEVVLEKVAKWGTPENLMFVVGATKAKELLKIRHYLPEHFLLVPGVGAQDGSLKEVSKYGMNKDCGILVNSTRGIIYASSGKDFAEKARQEAIKLQKEMEQELIEAEVIS